MVNSGAIKVEAFFYAVVFTIVAYPFILLYNYFNPTKNSVGGGSQSTNMLLSILVGAILILSLYFIITIRRKRNVENIEITL